VKIAIISANLGNFEKHIDWVEQKVEGADVSVHRFDDKTFPPRKRTMHPRLQARIVKMFGWEMAPGHDYYLWVDSSRALLRPDALAWFFEKGKDKDLVLFKHPQRNTIKEEADFIKSKLSHKYLDLRYAGELIDEQLKAIPDTYVDNKLYASTAFFYKDSQKVRSFLTAWWVHTSRYHAVDQLALPYLVWNHNCSVHELDEDVYNCEYIPVVR